MLSISNLDHTYANGVHALNDINLDIPKGMFGLLGPNGAGKSSLMRTLATLQQPTSGTITLGNNNVLTQPQQIRQLLGYLPQDFGLYPRANAEQLLNHIAILKGVTERKHRTEVVKQLLHQTNLYAVRHHALATFSGGMRQRFGIAQALIGKPELIIVDEPTAGLDPEERNRFHNLLAEIGEEVIVILSTHIVGDVNNLCANMAIMNKGQIIKKDTPQSLINKLNGYIWHKLIDKSDFAAMQNEYCVISHHLIMGKLSVRVYAEQRPIGGFEKVEANLEDVYFCAINRSTIEPQHDKGNQVVLS